MLVSLCLMCNHSLKMTTMVDQAPEKNKTKQKKTHTHKKNTILREEKPVERQHLQRGLSWSGGEGERAVNPLLKAEQEQSWIGWRGRLPSPADEIPLSGGRELHLQDFTAPLFITWLCQVGHH